MTTVVDLSLDLSFIGGTHVAALVTVLAAAAFAARGRLGCALAVLLAVAATQLSVALVKVLVARPRPVADDAFAHASGFSFPSGHASTGVALYGTLALLSLRYLGGPLRFGVAAAALALGLSIGVSRIYLGVHYPTDVLAGWLLGAAVALAALALATRLEGAPHLRSG